MSKIKSEIELPSRTPAYVSIEVGAAELCISPDTWDEWVKVGRLPRATFYKGRIPRWRWSDVDAILKGSGANVDKEPFFRIDLDGKTSKGRRKAA
jgi:hypothetical protein